jgi:hypothetical protein
MQALTLPARRGWHWLSDGFAIFRRRQLLLSFAVLGYWMVMALISAFPYIGRIAAMVLIPVFSVSLMNACRLLESSRPGPLAFAPPLLFSGFRKNLPPLLKLGVVYFACTVGVLALVALVDDGVLFRMVVLGEPQRGEVLDGEAVKLAAQLALALFMPLMMAYWYAPVLVAWHDLPAGKSLFFSFVACLRNWRAFLVYGAAIVLFGALLPGVLAAVLSSVLPSGGVVSIMLTSLLVLFLLPTLYASFYISYRDVFVTVDDTV